MGVGKERADDEQGEFLEDAECSEPRGWTGEPKVTPASTRGNAKAGDELKVTPASTRGNAKAGDEFSGARAAAAQEPKAESEGVASITGRLSAATGAEDSI